LDGAWGDVAYSVAVSARDGLMALVARGAPDPNLARGVPESGGARTPDANMARSAPAPKS
jgi:hypothetical protein